MRRAPLMLLVLATCASAVLAQAPSLEQIQQDNQRLREENQQIQQALSELREQVGQLQGQMTDEALRARCQEESRALLREMVEEMPDSDQWVRCAVDQVRVKIYGFARLDAYHDTRQTGGGYVSLFVRSNAPTISNDATNLHIRGARLGFDFAFPEYNGLKTAAKIEIDPGTPEAIGTSELSPEFRVRHLYLTVELPESESLPNKTRFLFGQTWDVFSPQMPYTNDLAVLWMAGNPGYRRPQARMENEWLVADGHKLITQIAIARAVGGDTMISGVSDGLDDGIAGSWPDLQARVAYLTRVLTEKDSEFGVSGVVGRREVETGVVPEDYYTAWGVSVDASLPLVERLLLETDRLGVRGEWYLGQGLGGYFGNAGQFYDVNRRNAISGTGGWVELAYILDPKSTIRTGWGMDCVDEDDLSTSSQREANSVSFINYSYAITPNLIWAIEYQYMRTAWFLNDTFVNHRVGTSITLKF